MHVNSACFYCYDLGFCFSFSVLRFNRIPLYGVFILTFGGALIFAILVRFLFVPWLRKRINEEVSQAEEPIVQYTPTSDVEKKVTDTKTGATVEDESETVIDFHDDSGRVVFWVLCEQVMVLRSKCWK